jgi:hypothetical protein
VTSKVLSALVAVALAGCASNAMLSESSDVTTCWLGEISGADFGNVLSICTQQGVATISNHFKNPGGIPTTCDSEGLSTSPAKGKIDFAFERGQCENGRSSGAFGLSCDTGRDRSLACRFVPQQALKDVYVFTRVALPAPPPGSRQGQRTPPPL